MISFDEAVALAGAAARPLGREEICLSRLSGRVLAAPVEARVAAPPADASAMDGYAVRDADLAALPARLRVVGEAFAGAGSPGALGPGECIRIFTGAPVPDGADRVIVQEAVRREGGHAVFETPPGAPRYIRPAGSDFRQGERLLDSGVLLGPRQLVAVAAADVAGATVWRRPRMTVLATGDELAEPGRAGSLAGHIPDSVSFGVAAIGEEWGARFTGKVTLADRLGEMEQVAEAALREADIVVVTGGASVGEKDFARRMFAGQAIETIFSKVAMKPGKPVWLGRAGERVVLGLPGNPTSAMVTARLFLAPIIAAMTGRDPAAALNWRKLPLAHAVEAAGERETFARGRIVDGEVRLAPNQDSGAQKTLAECGVLVRLAAGGTGLEAGQPVDVLDF